MNAGAQLVSWRKRCWPENATRKSNPNIEAEYLTDSL